jgi:hypothetical protein
MAGQASASIARHGASNAANRSRQLNTWRPRCRRRLPATRCSISRARRCGGSWRRTTCRGRFISLIPPAVHADTTIMKVGDVIDLIADVDFMVKSLSRC